MKLPLLRDHPVPLQIAIAIVLPIAYGALTGVMLGVSETWYLILSLAGILGGLGAGFDHDGPREAALRGVVGGVLFGGCILIAHAIAGTDVKADVPDPMILLAAITTTSGVILGAIGGAVRRRTLLRAAA